MLSAEGQSRACSVLYPTFTVAVSVETGVSLAAAEGWHEGLWCWSCARS